MNITGLLEIVIGATAVVLLIVVIYVVLKDKKELREAQAEYDAACFRLLEAQNRVRESRTRIDNLMLTGQSAPQRVEEETPQKRECQYCGKTTYCVKERYSLSHTYIKSCKPCYDMYLRVSAET